MSKETTERRTTKRAYLEKLRTNSGYSRSDIVSKLNLSYTEYYSFELGGLKTIKLVVSMFVKLSPIFNVSIYDLMCLETDYQLSILNLRSDDDDNNNVEDFCVALIRVRKKNAMSQTRLAEKLGISKQYVSRIEQGTVIPSREKIEEICRIFELPLNYFNENIEKSKQNKQKGK